MFSVFMPTKFGWPLPPIPIPTIFIVSLGALWPNPAIVLEGTIVRPAAATAAFFRKEIITDERLREREKGPEGNNHGMFQKRWADHDYHEEGGESIAMVQKRNMEALNEILSDNADKEVVVGTHGTALSTILNFYDNSFVCEEFLRIIDWMPYIIELDFEGDKLVGKQEHCHVEKEFKGKQRADKK